MGKTDCANLWLVVALPNLHLVFLVCHDPLV